MFADEAGLAIHHAGALSVIRSIPDSVDDQDMARYKSDLLKRFQDMRYD